MESGPTCQPQPPLNGMRRSPAHHRVTPHMVTRWSSYTTGHHCPTCALLDILISCVGIARGTTLHFASSRDHTAHFHLCPTLTQPPLLAGMRHHWPLPFLSESPRRTTVPVATSTAHSKLEPMAIAFGTSTSSTITSSPMSSPSQATICAPSAPPSLRGGWHYLVARLHRHLRRRQHLVRAVAANPLTIAIPPR
jgi:hypothetical protein